MTSYATRDRINEKSYKESLPYKMEEIDSSQIDTATYQRKLNRKKVERIAAEFNERIARAETQLPRRQVLRVRRASHRGGEKVAQRRKRS